ncbi:hypothetical protein BC834DRAFT_970718 [Gloeopeniophorella convolvens]|nr:hypothetical protein BC834DRAFT_970718 [Gloeopeniophorella convolvens]
MSPRDDWIIEDSEEEDQLDKSEPNHRPATSGILQVQEDRISSIQAFTSIIIDKTLEPSRISTVDTTGHIPAQTMSAISSFPPLPQADVSNISKASTGPSSRPRPRPIFNRSGTDSIANTSVSDPVLLRTPISDRAPQPIIAADSEPLRAVPRMSPPAPAIEDFSLDIAERTKMRSRKAARQPVQYIEEVIDITDDELLLPPVQKPKPKPRPRPVKPVQPLPYDLHPPSDPMTVPIPSSSLPLPPSDPFPASTIINSSPPRQPPLDESLIVPGSSPEGSPMREKKRKRAARLESPVDESPIENRLFVTRTNMSPPPPPPIFAGPSAATSGAGLDKDLDFEVPESDDEYGAEKPAKKPKKPKKTKKSDDVSSDKPTKGKRKSTKKSIVEVVIMSPRKKKDRSRAAASSDAGLEEGASERNNDRLPSSSRAKAPQAGDDDDDVFMSQLTSDDDELVLAPKRRNMKKPPAASKADKGKQKALEPQIEDDDVFMERKSGDERNVADREDDEDDGGVGRRKSRSRSIEPHVPLKENVQPSTPVKGDDPPKLSPSRETPGGGKPRHFLGRMDRNSTMKDIIRRASSHTGSPFAATPPAASASPLVKMGRSALRRIAPLHPNRRTPPPPPPRPPAPKKSKKMLELEEKWEMELEDEVEGWYALTDEERQQLRVAKRNKELGYDD